ncbi:helix-turn-helix domain-containing protein [Natronomonas gomsonensis]|uniref:winged helix-turn-helix domain-containing protein n=1 Tax=Natronomonas gomsonensis TaxID=1046043 RepID=UPI0015BF0E4A|nr:helix-turn-helix domain-containing protein [Natronomonas gomsonensis]
MSQSSKSFPSDDTDRSSQRVRAVDAEPAKQRLLDALDDRGCRAILDATSDEVLSANEVSETCDLPLSTTYRKLDLLTDSGLLEERTRIRRSGKHASEFYRAVEDVLVSLGTHGGISLHVIHREHAEKVVPTVPR